MTGTAFPMLIPLDGNDRNRDVAARDAAPVRGAYICNDHFAAECPERPMTGGTCEWGGTHCWHESAARRIAQQGGPSSNAAADLAAWNRLGSRQSRAA